MANKVTVLRDEDHLAAEYNSMNDGDKFNAI